MIVLIALALASMCLILLTNLALFPRIKPLLAVQSTPFVSILIPARNEAQNIQPTLNHLLQQSYPNFEIIVLNDNSDDTTRDIAQQFAQAYTRLTVIDGCPLPSDWMGKNWACQQMAEVAKGDYLLFTDADVIWKQDSLQNVMQAAQATDSDLYTVWPTQITETWSERLCVPLMAMVILGYLPVIGTHFTPLSVFAAANGQCMLWRKAAYRRLGGHQAVHNNILEDVTMARMTKKAGLRLRMADGNGYIQCRMYTTWPEVRDGYAKNILAGYGGSIPLLIGAGVFHLAVFIVPWLWLLQGIFAPWPMILIATGLLVRMTSAAFTRQRLLDGLFLPVSVVLMMRIALQAIWWHYHQGGPRWKGRVIRQEHPSHG